MNSQVHNTNSLHDEIRNEGVNCLPLLFWENFVKLDGENEIEIADFR